MIGRPCTRSTVDAWAFIATLSDPFAAPLMKSAAMSRMSDGATAGSARVAA
jgi:hypothetical protein